MDELQDFEQRLALALDRLAGPVPTVDAVEVARAAVRDEHPQHAGSRHPSTKGVRSMFTANRAIAAGVMLALVSAAFLVVPRGTPQSPAAIVESTRVPATAESPRIDWASKGIELKADDLSLRVGDSLVSAPGEVLPLGSTYAGDADLEAWWYENGSVQRLLFQLGIDDSDWWIDTIRAYDGYGDDSDWIYFEDLAERTRTPIGESLTDDLHLESTDASKEEYQPAGSATLDLDGLRLTAFAPGSRPAPLRGCDFVEDDGVEVEWIEWEDGGGYWSAGYEDGVLQGRGEPLRRYDKKTPKKIESALQKAGLCYRFDHSWKPAPQFEDARLNRELELYFDRRCSAPESGKVGEVSFGVDHPSGEPGVIVYVEVHETEPKDWPEPPSYGTDCPSQ